ncbi:LysR family transcriptional regulator [Paenibacillus solisilvae]|uniref:LysR family transcriptional regulator n=1 Tax=Paenibacillus solisilvae TaxID=2486751 RepID=A0ABW0VTF2_9BACL
MSLLKMRILVLLEKLKKVTAVADELGMKQPTISFHMRKLEEEWGVPLFEMKTGKVMLTTSGKLLHHYAEQIDRIYNEAQSRFHERKQSGRHTYVIGSIDAASAILLQGSWFKRIAEITDMQFSFTTASSGDLFDSLLAGSIDLVLSGGLPASPLLHHELVLESSLSLYIPDQHPLSQSPGVPSYRLAGSPFIQVNEPSLQAAIKQWENSERITLQTDWHTDRVELALSAVRSGLCLAILPSNLNSFQLDGIQVIPLPGQNQVWQLYACWRSDYWNPPLLQRILQLLHNKKTDNPTLF